MMTTRALSAMVGVLFLGTAVASAHAADMIGHHTMNGEVTKVDAKRGWIDVKTPEGSMKLHFPPDALTNIKKGDSVSVDLGLRENNPSASVPERPARTK
jgi:hypothetical protein